MKFYEIIYRHGKKKDKIVIQAPNKLDVMKKFQAMEIGVRVSLKEINEPMIMKAQKIINKHNNPIKDTKINIEQYISALQQLSVMLDAGMPINICLIETIKSTQDPMLKAILENVSDDIEGGQSLTSAFTPYSRQLGNLSISMFNLGEQSGTLSESLTRLADILQNINDNRVKLKKATRYPLFVIIAMSIAFTVVITFVVPQFEDLFSNMKTELPFPTQLLLWLENAITTYGPYILVAGVILSIVFSYVYKKSYSFALKVDQLLLKTYLVGTITKFAMLGRFVYIFDILVHAGIPIVDALKAASSVVDNLYMKKQFQGISKAIEEGRSLYDGFEASGFFESMVLQMLKAGEDSGALNNMLGKITIYYNKKYNDVMDSVTEMIEPILTAGIAGFVLVLALGIFLPMWSMADAMGM
ncbi:MAG: type II secretion system F family protein [Campylobacterota bacterium]|nr:type II secretion system F family protein [Campylobacterota bacterium]